MLFTRKRRLIFITAIIGIPLIALIAFAAIALTRFSPNDFDLGPEQDCIGVPIALSGMVQDMNGNPVTEAHIIVRRFPSAGNEKLVELDSNDIGRFEYNKEIRIFACDYLSFEVTAKGFRDRQVQYVLFDHYSESEISTEKRNLIEVNIELQRLS